MNPLVYKIVGGIIIAIIVVTLWRELKDTFRRRPEEYES